MIGASSNRPEPTEIVVVHTQIWRGTQVAREDYTWDVFVSFRRSSGIMTWIKDSFQPNLEFWLSEELPGGEPRIFVDEHELESLDWPLGLAKNHSESAVLVALLSRNYRESPWCRREYELMVAREKETGFASGQQPMCLIQQVIVHDCDELPDNMRRRNSPNLYPYVFANLARHGKRAEKLEGEIKQWAPKVVEAIRASPPRQDTWFATAITAMNETYDMAPARQTTVPGRIR